MAELATLLRRPSLGLMLAFLLTVNYDIRSQAFLSPVLAC
jgi:hypothetical protein